MRTQRWMMSLTARLTLLFALVSAAILIALGYIIESAIETHFRNQDYIELHDKLRQLTGIVEHLDRQQRNQVLSSVMRNSVPDHDNILTQIETPQGKTLFATAALQLPYNINALIASPGQKHQYEWQESGTGYRGLAAIIPTSAGQPPLILSVALETTRHTRFLAQFHQELFGFMAGAILLSALLGWLAARKGLAPLRLMRTRAERVTAHNLDQRLPVATIPNELASLADTLNKMLDRLEESFTRLTDFSSDLAHELRTPISNLMTQTQVVLSQPRSAEEYREILASNAEELEKLSRMTSDMLFLARAEHGLALPQTETVVLEQEVDKLFDFYEALAEAQDVRMFQQGNGTLEGDPLMLRRALSNLISNALRHTPTGGEINVRIEQGVYALKLHIDNEGPGIPADELPHLFDRFYRCDRTRSHALTEGAGLGLSITRAIIEAHGGRIYAHSEPGKTTFTLVFKQ